MLRILVLAFTLATVCGFVVNSQSQTPAPSQSAQVELQTEDEKRLLKLLSLAPEPCGQVSFIETTSPPAHGAWFLGNERIRISSEFAIANDGLELRKAVVMNLRGQIKLSYGSPSQDAAPALKALDSVINSFRNSADKDTEKLQPVKKDKIVAARKAVLASLRVRLRAQIPAAYASSVPDVAPALKVLDDELTSIEQERGTLRAETAKQCASINTSLRRPDMH
jgi:hypothetical protein